MTPWHIGLFMDTLCRQYPGMPNYTAEEAAAAKRRYYAGMLNVAPRYLTSAETAKERLTAISKQDREACNDGKWVKLPTIDADLAFAFALSGMLTPSVASKIGKRRCRWQVRR